MRETKMTGETCVGEVRLSALDVGFDVRQHPEMRVSLPAEFGSVGLDRSGETYLVEGTREELVAAIVAAGYLVAEREAAALLGRKGGQAGRGASQRRGDSAHYATLGDRPVVAVRHTAAGELLEDWPIIGRARSLTAAIRVARQAGYTVPDRGTPGYCWDPQDRTPHQDDAHLTDAERQAEHVSCWSVPVLV